MYLMFISLLVTLNEHLRSNDLSWDRIIDCDFRRGKHVHVVVTSRSWIYVNCNALILFFMVVSLKVCNYTYIFAPIFVLVTHVRQIYGTVLAFKIHHLHAQHIVVKPTGWSCKLYLPAITATNISTIKPHKDKGIFIYNVWLYSAGIYRKRI